MKTRAGSWIGNNSRLETLRENGSTSTLNSNLLTNWWWIHATISQRVNFWQCCIANAKWMPFGNWKVAIFYVVNGAALELQFARKSYVSVITLRFWAPESTEIWRGVCSRININDLRFFFLRIVALEYWCLGVSLLSGVFDKLIRAVSVRRQLAQKKRPVIRYTIIHVAYNVRLVQNVSTLIIIVLRIIIVMYHLLCSSIVLYHKL